MGGGDGRGHVGLQSSLESMDKAVAAAHTTRAAKKPINNSSAMARLCCSLRPPKEGFECAQLTSK